jgi:hypothetical protein
LQRRLTKGPLGGSRKLVVGLGLMTCAEELHQTPVWTVDAEHQVPVVVAVDRPSGWQIYHAAETDLKLRLTKS